MMTYVSGDATYIPGGGSWRSWCSDINAGMTSGNFLFEASQFPEGLPAGGTNPTWVENGGLRAAYLYHKYAPTIGLTDDIRASAMAIAIWEVLYDQNNDLATYGLNGGQWGFLAAAPDPASSGFQAVQLAQSWLNSAASVDFGHADGSWDYNMTYWRPLQTPGVNYLQQGGFGPVPEPAEIALVIAALIGLAMGYKRVSSGRKETQEG